MSVTRETISEIARELFEAKRGVYTVPYVSPRLPERDLDSAYAISAEFAALRERELGVRRVGRKVGLTNALVQQRVGIDEPDYGIIHDDMVHPSGTRLPLSAYNRLLIEAEVAFVLKSDVLEPSRACVEAAIDYVTPAFEVVDFRYAGSVGQIVDTIADNAGCSGVVLGEERHPYGEVDLTQVEMVITGGGQEITRGVGANVLGTRSTRSSGWPGPRCAPASRCAPARCCCRAPSATSSRGPPTSSASPPSPGWVAWSRPPIRKAEHD